MKVKFLTPVQHDAQSYQIGESAELPGKAANLLIDCGAAEQVDLVAEKEAAKASAQAQHKEEAEAVKLAAEAGKLV